MITESKMDANRVDTLARGLMLAASTMRDPYGDDAREAIIDRLQHVRDALSEMLVELGQ